MGGVNVKETAKRLVAALRGQRLSLWLCVGVIGIALIALSEWRPRDRNTTPLTPTATAQQVEAALEERIESLLSAVEGVGNCRVMVTLESESRAVYAADTAADGDSLTENVLTVATDTGPVGLLLTRVCPTVKGVAVVCRGGGDPAVQERVVQVVSTAFHISDRRVCVVKQD